MMITDKLFPMIMWDKPADKGAEAKPSTGKSVLADVRRDIVKTSKDADSAATEGKKPYLDYFSDDDDGPEGGEDDAADKKDSDDTSKKKFFDPMEDLEGEDGEEPEGDTTKKKKKVEAGEDTGADDEPEGGEGDDLPPIPEGVEIPEEEKDFYYLPERDAHGLDVFPNKFKDRQAAEHGIAAKIDSFDQEAEALKEMDVEAGEALPVDILNRIEQLRDVTTLESMDDNEVRTAVRDLDMALKAVKDKGSRTQTAVASNQKIIDADKGVEQTRPKASLASKSIGLAERITREEPKGFDEILRMADEQISTIMDPLEKAVKDHEANEKFIEEKGHSEFLSQLRTLEKERDDKRSELAGYRDDIVAYNDAVMKAETVKTQNKQPTQAEMLKKYDDTFLKWQDNRSTGPFALEVFSSPTTDPVVHLRKFAFAPANVKKFDLSTMKGWDEVHAAWKADQQKRFSDQQAQKMKKKETKRTSSVPDPIPDPDDAKTVQSPRKSSHSEISKLNSDIRRTARELSKGLS